MVFQQGAISRATLITLATFTVLIILAILFLPSGFSNDISKIGNGTKLAVFAYNNGTTPSMSMMNLMEQIRSSYSNKIEFLVVSITAPTGKKFLKDYNIKESTLVLFNGDGSIARTLFATGDEILLRKTLDEFIR